LSIEVFLVTYAISLLS